MTAWFDVLLDPHPELVAAQRVTAADVMLAAVVYGWLPEAEERFSPVHLR